METYAEIINAKLVRPANIRGEVYKSCMSILVEFADGVVVAKVNTEFKTFMSIVRNLKFENYDNFEDCVPEKIGYYQLFGYRVGDKLRVSSEDTFLKIILVS